MRGRVGLWIAGAVIVALAVAVFAVRYAGPWAMLDYDQDRPIAYMLDIVVNGEWLVQTDLTGDIASKPPLYTWLVALLSVPIGEVTRLTMYLPGLGSWIVMALAALLVGHRRFGLAASAIGGAGLILSTFAFHHVHQGRTDALFGATTTVSAVLAFLAWDRRARGLGGSGALWAGFWVGAAMTTLTKGPLGVLLAVFGLFAIVWERRTLRRSGAAPAETGGMAGLLAGHAVGIAAYLTLCLGWFVWGYLYAGQPFIDKLIGRELVHHTLQNNQGDRPLTNFYKVWFYFVVRGFPWSIFALWGLWRVWKSPAEDPGVRRFERFLFWWLLGGLLLYTVSPYIRGRMLIPIFAPATLLAGRQIVEAIAGWRLSRRAALAAGAVVVALTAHAINTFLVEGRGEYAERTARDREAAAAILDAGIDPASLRFTGGSMALQYYLGVKRNYLPETEAARLLREEAGARYVVIDESQRASFEDAGVVVLRLDGAFGPLRVIGAPRADE